MQISFSRRRSEIALAVSISSALLWTLSGCQNSATAPEENRAATNPSSSDTTPAATAETAVEAAPQKELFKPAAGKGNVQGKVLWNDEPAPNIEVTLSEKFSSFLGASGKTYSARTDKSGNFVIKDVPPKEYEGLTARVFDTPMLVFMQSGILQAKKYTVEADKTLFIDPTHLFKSDLKILAPKASQTLKPGTVTIKWQPYAGATYYKFSLYPDQMSNNVSEYEVRVDGTSYQTAKPLTPDTYRIQVAAYNGNDHKIAECPDSYKFKVAP